MSRVTNAILTSSVGEDFAARLIEVGAAISEWSGAAEGQNFVSVEDPSLPHGWYGGYKFLECDIAIAAFNYVGPQVIMDAVSAAKWRDPGLVRVFILDQEDDCFSPHEITKPSPQGVRP